MHFTESEKRALTEYIHLNLVENIIQHKAWVCKNIVFHGGTSLHLAWRSPRFSEDVDFLVDEEKEDELVSVIKNAAKRLDADMKVKYGGHIELKEKKGPGSGSPMLVYSIKYSHPEKRGKIHVKAEFMKTTKYKLDLYDSVAKDMDSSDFDLPVKPFATVGTLKMLYIDKILAVAARPYLKTRDFFDLWWIRQSNSLPGHQNWLNEFLDKLEFDCSIYDIAMEDIQNKLARFVEHTDFLTLKEQLQADLENWLPNNLYQMFKNNDTFEEMVHFAEQELQSVQDTLNNQKFSPGM